MLPTINLVYNRKHNRKVEICIYHVGKRRYLSTGVAVPEKGSFRNGIVSGCSTAPMLNKTLTAAVNAIQEQLQSQIKEGSCDVTRFTLKMQKPTDSFFEWAIERSNESPIKASTKLEESMVLARWRNEGIELFSDLTPDKIRKAVRSFEARLRPTTVRLYATRLKKFISMAIEDKIITENPMDAVRLPKGKCKAVCYLTREELSLIEQAECEGRMERARDMFLFSCYTGLAYSDLVKIKKSDLVYIEDKPYIIDRRKKTGGDYRIRLLPKAMAILSKYGFNLDLMKNNIANGYLSALERKVGLKKHISMHVGRHTFATLALSAGVRIETVSRMLAHSDIKTTQIYAKVLQKDVDEGFDILESI